MANEQCQASGQPLWTRLQDINSRVCAEKLHRHLTCTGAPFDMAASKAERFIIVSCTDHNLLRSSEAANAKLDSTDRLTEVQGSPLERRWPVHNETCHAKSMAQTSRPLALPGNLALGRQTLGFCIHVADDCRAQRAGAESRSESRGCHLASRACNH